MMLAEIIFEYNKLNLNLFLTNKKINWCKWLMSGDIGDFLTIFFLKIEKRVSKQGYHNNSIIKKGDKILFKL